VHAQEQLPKPTRDLARVRRDLDEFGYGYVLDALDRDERLALHTRLFEQAAAELERGLGWRDGDDVRTRSAPLNGQQGPNQRVWMLINKGQVFRDLVQRPLIGQIVPHLLGEEFLLSSLTANIASSGGAPMVLHSDQGYVPQASAYPFVCNVVWLLNDVDASNGGTRLVPGSHRLPAPEPSQVFDTPSVAAEAPAGTALVFDGRLWHGTGANTTREPRAVLLSYFCRPFVRQQENMTVSLRPELYDQCSPELKQLLGFKVTGSLGRVDGVHPTARVRRGYEPIAELQPQVDPGRQFPAA
jgi:ectoine hydroxylase-related dioxygenase (phytanoyl-CoA dioxygenase family)